MRSMTGFYVKGGIVFTLFVFSINFAFSEIKANEDMNEILQGINRIVHPLNPAPDNHDNDKRDIIHLSGDDAKEAISESVLMEGSETEINQGDEKKSLNKIKNEAEQSSLLGRYTILSNQLSSDGKYTIKLKVNVSDKKGRVALRTPVIFRVNNGAVPGLFTTLTNISGDATFEFINYNRGNMLVSAEFDGQDMHIPISLK